MISIRLGFQWIIFSSMDYNRLYVILILRRFLIKCRRVDKIFLGLKHNTSKSHRFWWDFKKLKIRCEIPQNPLFYKIQKNPSAFEYHQMLMDFKQSQLNTIGFLSII